MQNCKSWRFTGQKFFYRSDLEWQGFNYCNIIKTHGIMCMKSQKNKFQSYFDLNLHAKLQILTFHRTKIIFYRSDLDWQGLNYCNIIKTHSFMCMKSQKYKFQSYFKLNLNAKLQILTFQRTTKYFLPVGLRLTRLFS